ncbi:adenine phosphoribosyltransferase [Allopseudospirillum japonicum]|uniref:Adenine phosphoribosyltransferase n=1 Tax=Allopseudospirillum japonicum TaxID=64971 RepID=A0A1H6RZR3_9GAMM|nr:adenine phosphoribosyltransferase [Allopseudospirillum japonicum]SEI59906.1 adenine phosphoribosyltransferase [Allopseudospirillum japonicum]
MHPYSQDLKQQIRTVRDWPKTGVNFRDITPLLQNPSQFRKLIDLLVHRYQSMHLDAVAAVDARGFIIGAPLAYALGVSFVPVRKSGKLPFSTVKSAYNLEYGQAEVELHTDAFAAGAKVLLIDDLLATGGTLLAGIELIQALGAQVVEAAVLVELSELGGREKLAAAKVPVFGVCAFNESE